MARPQRPRPSMPAAPGAPARLTRRGFLGAAALAGAGVPLLSSCGGGGGAGGSGDALSFWQFYAPGGDVPGQVDWFTGLVDAWNGSHERKIELRYVPTTEYVSGSVLQTAFSSGDGPDLFLISPGDFLRYYNGDALHDLTSAVPADVVADYVPGALETRSVDGKIYGLPMEQEPLAIYYSLDAFEQAGLSEADVPTSWDAFLDVAQRLTTPDRFGCAFETAPGYYQNFTWYPFMWMGSTSGGEQFFEPEAATAALDFWKRAVETGVAPRELQGDGGSDLAANLGSGYCAMQQSGIWSIAQMEQNSPDVRYGVFKLPVPDGGQYVTITGGWAFVANARGADPEAAAEFITYALGSASEDSLARGVSWATEAKTGIPPRQSVRDRAKQEGKFSDGVLATFLDDIASSARSEPRVPPEVYKPISDAIQACMLAGADPAESAAKAAEQIDAFLGKYDGAPIL